MTAGDIHTFREKHNPKKAIVLEGVDDYVQVDAWATDRQTANDSVGTITAWVMPRNDTGTFTIIAAGDVNADEFIDFSIVAGLLHIELSIAGTTSFDIESDNKVVPPHVWTHVAIVQNGSEPRLYANGKLIDSTLDAGIALGAGLDHWFQSVTAIDAGNIGILDANTSTTQDFLGAIGPVKHWNKALTAAEINQDYKGGAQNAAAVALQVSHWDWDGLTDKWVGANDGTIVSAAVLNPVHTSMTSRLKTAATIVADDISIGVDDGGIVTAVVVKAA